MGYDLIFGPDDADAVWCNGFELDFLYKTAVRFGWKPAGAVPMKAPIEAGIGITTDFEAPRVDYFHNEWQLVTDEDAKAWAEALYRALEANDALGGQIILTKDEASFAREFADYASKCGFRIA
jgi:hypothetical protein